MKPLLYVLLLSLPFYSFSQKEWNNWYFGSYCAISFNSGQPVAVSGCAMYQWEGSASVSDTAGNLLFYTDGVSVWDHTNSMMPNGYNLTGNFSSTQSAIILPSPGNSNQYYIFTAQSFENFGGDGYAYCIVDMSLNGGKGDVITNSFTTLPGGPCSEKLTAATNAAHTGYWVVTHPWGGNAFLNFELTAAGLSAPVVCITGANYDTDSLNVAGYIKFSNSGKQMASALAGSSVIEIYNFDNTTGKLTYSFPLNIFTVPVYSYAYGIAFSPDDTKLYADNGAVLYQFDMMAGDSTAINASKKQVGASSSLALGAIQQGPDKRLYLSRLLTSYLAVINYPNLNGNACNFIDLGFSMPDSVNLGLPNIPVILQSTCTNLAIATTGGKTILCSNDSAFVCAGGGYTNYEWNTGSTNSCIQTKEAGDYYVTVTDANGCTAQSNHLAISVYPVPSISIIETGDTLSSYGEPGYQWYLNGNLINDATLPQYVATLAGSYTLQVTDTNGCTAQSEPVIINATGLQQLTENIIEVYPNPNVSGSWQLAVGNELIGSKLDVYDSEGRLVFHSEIRNQKSAIDLPLSKGVYYLQIENENGKLVQKLVGL